MTHESRHSPFARFAVLSVLFLLLLVAGIVTVLVPELSDDPDDSRATSEEAVSR